MDIRNFNLRRGQVMTAEEDWSVSDLNKHAPFSPHAHPNIFICPLQLGSQKKKLFLGKKMSSRHMQQGDKPRRSRRISCRSCFQSISLYSVILHYTIFAVLIWMTFVIRRSWVWRVIPTGRDRSTRRNPLSQGHFVNHQCHVNWPGIESNHRDRRSATNCLSHDAALSVKFI